MAGDCKAVLEHFSVRDGVLVGHSMGAFLSVVLAECFPDVVRKRLRGMLFIAGHAGIVAKGSIQNRLQIPLVKAGLMPAILSSEWLGRAFTRSLFGRVADREFVEATRLILASQKLKVMTPLVDFQVQEDHYPGLASIGVETLVLCGERDRTCPRWHSERLGAEIPSARNVWLSDIGHMVVYEAPDAVENAVTQLVKGQP
jgi:pimeloyl-ACP methyl ester carboxylesterase